MSRDPRCASPIMLSIRWLRSPKKSCNPDASLCSDRAFISSSRKASARRRLSSPKAWLFVWSSSRRWRACSTTRLKAVRRSSNSITSRRRCRSPAAPPTCPPVTTPAASRISPARVTSVGPWMSPHGWSFQSAIASSNVSTNTTPWKR